MKIQVTALSSFMHGRIHMNAGETGEFSKGDAEDLEKAGLVQIADGHSEPTKQSASTGAAETGPDDMDDVLGDEKAEQAPDNKMEKAVENKATRSRGK